MPPSEYILCTCQAGVEPALKAEVAARAPQLKLSFSRPGFVTFKLPQPTTLDALQLPRMVFARTRSLSLGKLGPGESLRTLAAELWQSPVLADLPPFALHVWQRDHELPGEGGFEPGPSPLTAEVESHLLATAPEGKLLPVDATPGRVRPAPANAIVLDVVLVEPNEWWVGLHRAETRVERFAGGVFPAPVPADDMVSRAYLKIYEALRWSSLPAQSGDTWVELGCAPGGASQVLLEMGMRVIGVDPAEVDEDVLAHPYFTHIRRRTTDVPRKELVGAHWLAADLNVAPSYTLEAVESFVTHPSSTFRGLVLTLKLSDWSLAAPELMREYIQRVQGWGFHDVRVRQLAYNRREMCLVALKSRGQRRMTRR